MAQKNDEKTYPFPKGLIDAQVELNEVRGELNPLFKKQPWSVEPLAAWTTHENHWRPSSRPESPGWDPADHERIGRLRARELELAALIVNHPFWKEIAAEERAEARTKLKHHRQPTEKAAA
ncbi:hypothetical protein RB628_35175 [Streptomyces sp. ADMS]|uniref:hypothetical protein n=1 Tax=Streptomyces sp. ADMS TaxID=3071415 RepID=UPI00296F120D|nr:hypothetical protein [Streptomyces sp. ADMS]MDW4910432.1 hypothetical protein [Streptomyces sp. ADMS]